MSRPAPLRLVVAALAAGALAQPLGAAEPADLAARVMESCGVNRTLAAIGPQVAQQVAQMPPTLPAELREALAAAMQAAFTTKLMSAHVAPRMAALSSEELAAMRDWCASPLGRKVTAEELRASGSEAEAALADYIEALQKKPAKAARVKLAERIEKASAAVPVALAMLEGVAAGVASGANAALPAERRRPAADIEAELAQQRAGLQAAVAPFMRAVILFSYERLSDRELERYVRVLESPAGRAFSAAFSAGYLAGMQAAAQAVGAEIVQRLDPRRSAL